MLVLVLLLLIAIDLFVLWVGEGTAVGAVGDGFCAAVVAVVARFDDKVDARSRNVALCRLRVILYFWRRGRVPRRTSSSVENSPCSQYFGWPSHS